MMVSAIGDPYLKRRYALFEAKRASSFLKEESVEKLGRIAKLFNWKLRTLSSEYGDENYQFALHFTDYLRNTAGLQARRWKLVNRRLERGEVYLSRNDVARLLEEEVRRHIETKLDVKILTLPKEIEERVAKLRLLLLARKGKMQLEEIPKIIVTRAFPPCIKVLYEQAAKGRHISHIGRFTLTTFLVNSGMETEKVIDLFRASSDFNERMTRYQVEHIAGVRGSRTKYIPPRCDTLRTHGVCPGADELCKRIRHPLAYYRRKLRSIKSKPLTNQK